MNLVLAAHYNTVGREKLSAAGAHVDFSEALALRALWEQSASSLAEKVSSAEGTDLQRHVDQLGGTRAAQQKLSQAQPWLEAWDRGEKLGHAMARMGLKALIRERSGG